MELQIEEAEPFDPLEPASFGIIVSNVFCKSTPPRA